MGKNPRDKRDIYYRKAKEFGYRARSAFKLLQIDEKLNILSGIDNVVDLCAAPGSWTQVLVERVGSRDSKTKKVVSVDLMPMEPIPGAQLLQGDITRKATIDSITELLEGDAADMIVIDGAPDITGVNDADEFVQNQLLLAVC